VSAQLIDTVIVGAVVAGAVAFLLRRARNRARAASRTSACGSCTACPQGDPRGITRTR